MYNQDLYVLDGGIGKNICFTNCLAKLGKVNVMSTWPKVFTNNPNVNFSYDSQLNPLLDKTTFFNKFENIYMIQGYDPYFHRNKIHLINNFRRILNQDTNEILYNEIFYSEEEEEEIQPLLEKLESFILVQFIGSDEGSKETDFFGSRALTRQEAQEIINVINFDLKLNVVNVFSLKNHFNNTAQLDIQLDYRNYAHLIKYAKSFVAIDSSLNHMSANRFCNTKGVVLWNDENVHERFCYDKNINLFSNTPGVMRFDKNIILDSLHKNIKESK
jgi:hypothetical protein|tara:strand:+ start:3559 stop:4377 length:819 start_codon:yes stop_codon:yes gene_type:complete